MSSIESALPRLNEFIERQLPTMNAPGLALGLTHRDEILHASVYGLANQEAGTPLTPETLFQIGSISKSFTSIVLLQLQEHGLLDINDPVTKYLPWFEVQSVYGPITLRHLMSHTAGIIMGRDDTASAYTEAWNLRDTQATAPPGESFHYSNSGYKVLGLVLESVLKQSIGDILQERILDPLGMHASTAVISNSDRSRLAVGYAPFYDDRPLPPAGRLAPATWLETDTADGSVCSNSADMCTYLRMLLCKGKGLLAPKSFDLLVEPLIPTGEGPNAECYGLGLANQQLDGYHVVGHSGGMVGFTADLLAELEHGLGVIVLANGPAEVEKVSHFALKLARAAWNGEDLPEIPAEGTGMLEGADHFSGKYESAGKSFTLSAQGERLLLDLGSATVPLEPYGADRFLVPHPAFERFPLQFWSENGQVLEATYGGERYLLQGYPQQPGVEIPAEWQAYPGHYRSHNPWLSNFRVVLRQGSLVFIYPSGKDYSLFQLEPGLFRIGEDSCSPEFLRFEMVIEGKAMQAVLSGGAYSRTFTT